MKFDRNVTVFPTLLHREIYMKALRLVPPEVSLVEIEKTDPEMAASGREFYNFMLDLYGDMYCNPEAYGMTPGVYEAFAQYRKWRYMRLRVKEFHDNMEISGVTISSYVKFINEIALYCYITDGKCYLSYDDYKKVKDLKRVTFVHSQHLLLPIEYIMLALQRVELYFRDDGEKIQVISEKYPNMFLSASALRHAVEDTINTPVSKKLKYFFGEYIDTLEFRLLQGIYYPNFEDQIRSLSDKDREAVIALDALTKEYKLRPNYKASLLGYEYTYKGKPMLGVGTNNDSWFTEPNRKQNLWVRHVAVNISESSDPSYFDNIEKLGEDFKKYYMRHLPFCRACTPYHTSGSAQNVIFGKKVRLCSGYGGCISKFTVKDLPYIRKYIELYINGASKE